MADICFYFQLHQPLRIRPYSIFDVGSHSPYFHMSENREILERVSQRSYQPGLLMMQKLMADADLDFKASFSLSGMLIEQLEAWRMDVIDQFKELRQTDQVEFLGESYYHSLAFEFSRSEFRRQIKLHKEKIKDLFDFEVQVFRNTELIYHNPLAFFLKQEGFKGLITEGTNPALRDQPPNQLFHAVHLADFPIILRNFYLSDDIAFRFSDTNWEHFPLSAEKFTEFVGNQSGELICIALDFESFGEHQDAATGIFSFFEQLIYLLKEAGHRFVLPSDLLERKPKAFFDAPSAVSWADKEKDVSAWMGNSRQKEALRKIYELESTVSEKEDPIVMQNWSYLQASDHFYYMSTKKGSDASVHQHFNPFLSPKEAYLNYMNIIADFQISLTSA